MAKTYVSTIPLEPTLNMKLGRHRQPTSPAITLPMDLYNSPSYRENPLLALEPIRKKITIIEAQRVFAVFEDTLLRTEIVTVFPFLLDNLERFSFALGAELVELFQHHGMIISSYNEIRLELDKQLHARAEKKRQAQLRKMQEEEERLQRELLSSKEAEGDVEETEEADGVENQPENEEKNEEREQYEEDKAELPSGEEERLDTAGSDDSMEYRLESTMRNLSLVAQDMSGSTRNILRIFHSNPAIWASIKDQKLPRDDKCLNLLNYLRELRDILKHRLLTPPEEEADRKTYLNEIAKRERKNAIVIKNLETDLKNRTEAKHREISKKNDVINKLQKELHQIEKFSEEQIRRVRTDAEKQESSDEKNSEGKRQKLQIDVAQLRSQHQNLLSEHRDSEGELRKKKYKIESEVENWIQKYDFELGELQDEYEEIDAIYTEEKKQLNELEEKFAALEIEYNAIMLERQLAREKRERAERELAMMIKAATTIQAFWRSFKVRKVLKARRKKKRAQERKAKKKAKKDAKRRPKI